MAHAEQMYFFQNVKHFIPIYFKKKKVLEIGSLDVNGSVRVFFEDCDYTGLDIGPGKCVDIVCKGEDFSSVAGDYDVVVSTEVFEHTENWDLIFLNMLRLMKPDGLLIFTCASLGRPQHGTQFSFPDAAPHVSGTTDYYRNLTADDFRDAFKLDYWFSNHFFVEGFLFFVGLGRRCREFDNVMKNFKKAYEDYWYKTQRIGLSHKYVVTGKK